MKNVKLAVLMTSIVMALSGCGGGGSNDNGGVDNSAMTLSLTPSGDQNVPANSAINLTMNASVRRVGTTDTNSVASMTWSVNALNGETINPVLSNASCTGSNISGASASCSTVLSMPQNATTGKWNVIATAKASNGTQRSENFNVSVNNTVYNLSAGSAQTIVGDKNQIFGAVKLDGVLSGQNGSKIVSVQWTQVSGPDTAVIANSNTLNASFTPTAVGKYTFNVQVVVDNVTLNAITTVDAQPAST